MTKRKKREEILEVNERNNQDIPLPTLHQLGVGGIGTGCPRDSQGNTSVKIPQIKCVIHCYKKVNE